MNYQIEDIARQLKEAREQKNLSQRLLSTKVGMPQSHISKIESGQVDLKLSSLIELARALDFEITLVPRKISHVVSSLIEGNENPHSPAYQLEEDERDDNG